MRPAPGDGGPFAAQLAQLDRLHQRRRRRVVDPLDKPGPGTHVRVEGRLLCNFCSNDYLGLSHHPEVIRAAALAMQRYGVGAGAAHLVSGHTREHHALEEELAAFTGREKALLFSTGYAANLGVISALADQRDTLVADKLNHASLVDGARLSGAKLRRYAHRDTTAAEHILQSLHTPSLSAAATAGQAAMASKNSMLVSDGVFSMDGDVAPVRLLAGLASRHDVMLMIDDAHGFGVLGANGGGTLEEAGLSAAEVPILMGTLGKALGTAGAFVAGDAALIDLLVQRARTYIYSTAPPPAIAAATRAALRLVGEEGWRRDHLRERVNRFRAGARELNLPLLESNTAIQPLIIGDAQRTLAWSDALMRAGFWVVAIRPPTVPAGSARLRITLSAAHTESEIDGLLAALAKLQSLQPQ